VSFRDLIFALLLG